MFVTPHAQLLAGARGASLVALGVFFTLCIKRWGVKQAGMLLLVLVAMIVEQRARIQLRLRRRQNMRRQTVFMLVNGQVTRLPAQHLEMLMRDGDFTAEDYELLLSLDEERAGGEGSNPQAASAESINALPVKRLELEAEMCTICLDVFCKGDKVKQMPCLHQFHPDCLDQWLHIKGTCPLCLQPV
ncbi:hypothetical protein BASA81_001858 [Batrachochytrium salamandrivorans]|nr:hypothetical protein BASA81_001858 [Batrachochytrium salamandrivorans]